MTQKPVILAVPKGRILGELKPLLAACGIEPEADFFDENSRKLRFTTGRPGLDLIRVRAFDVATFVAYGAADLGVVGTDVLEEFGYEDLYAPLDLGIGRCRLSLAAPASMKGAADIARSSHVRVATKYPALTARHFARRGVQAECVRLNGAMEIAPALGLAPLIVDLVSSGETLRANGLAEIETLMEVGARLIVGRTALKTNPESVGGWIEALRLSLRG